MRSLTSRERTNGAMAPSARFSRIVGNFVNLPLAELRAFQCHFQTIRSIAEHSVPSDHAPVRLTLESLRAKQQDHRAIRRWLVQHPIFISALLEEHGNMIYDVDSCVALEQLKEVAFVVEGGPIFDPDEGRAQTVPALGRCLFVGDTGIPNDEAQMILSFVQPAHPDLNWSFQLDEFEELLACKRESAPGPDGLPCSVRLSADGIGTKFLFAASQAALRGAVLHQGFGACRTVFIPKTSEVDVQGLLIRSPGSFRPLTVCNCDCKILTAAMCSRLQRYSIECIHPHQRCVTQRIMTDNIFEIETVAIAMRPCYSKDPAILLTDFSCAYSSVDHRWIFMAVVPSMDLCGFYHTCRACQRGQSSR